MKKTKELSKKNKIFGQVEESLLEFCDLCAIQPGKNFLKLEPVAKEILHDAIRCSPAQFFLILQKKENSELAQEKKEFVLMINEISNGHPDLKEYPFSILVDGKLTEKSSLESIEGDVSEFQSFIKDQIVKGLSIDQGVLHVPEAEKLVSKNLGR